MTMNAKWEFSRRDALLVAAGGVAAALTSPGAARADTATVSGLVFEDKPGPGNLGLAGVLVSNGKDIAVTDADGRYTLPLPEEAVIFVIKPAGFMPPVDPATNLPRFYRLHQPDGSPASLNLTFAGVPPTGPLPASVDFALRRARPADAARNRPKRAAGRWGARLRRSGSTRPAIPPVDVADRTAAGWSQVRPAA